jgi:insulin receptor substrate 1
LTSTSGNFKVYELRVHSTAGTNAALNQPTNFISGNEDTGNPSRNAVDSNIDTYAATTSGDGTLEVTLETGIELLSFEIVLRDSSHLYNGTLELLDASRKSVVRHTIPAQSKTIFYYQENAKCPTDPPSASPSTSPTVSPTLSPTPNPTVSPSSSPSTSPSHSPSTSPSVSPTSSSPTSRPTVSPSASPTLTCYNDARTVRIESTTSQQIGFYEVIVTSSGVNKSPVGNATQSSTNGANVAVNAIDDNIDVYSLTAANDLNAYWQVELDSDYYVNDVIIANLYCGGLPSADAANGNCTCRLSGAVIKLLDSSNLLIVKRTLGNTCGQTILMEVFEENPNCRTMSPSTSPSTSPSKNPTKVPTRQPSKNPTKQPSQNPTKQPSKNPTKQPSKNPTQQPSKFPTAAPTKQPSKNPTQQPSKFPTTAPTKQPSKKPTKQPSKNPTSAPTKQPSKNPTKSPSTSPTAAPSSSPTSSPTLTCFNNIDQVRIKSTTGDRISVREVEVYSQGINRAANGTATQSSVDSSDPSAIATSAIDENVVSYSSTNNETGAYLLIDLRGTFDITSVTIRNRYCSNLLEGHYDSCKCYLSFATIEFIGNGVVVATRAVSNSCTLSDVTETLSSNDRCYPSQSPSLSRSPSESPSTTPSMRPSDSPSLSPSLSLMPTESAVINITITGSTTLTPTSRRRLVLYTIGNLSEDQSNDFIASAKATIEAVVCTGFEICEVRIPDIQLIGSSYVISFIIAVPKVCSTYDCSDSSVLLSQVNQTSTAVLQEAVTNGSLVTTLVQEMTIPTMKTWVQGTSATYVMDVVSIEYSPTHPRFPSTVSFLSMFM